MARWLHAARLIVPALAVAAGLAGCSGNPFGASGPTALQPFTSSQQMLTYLQGQATKTVNSAGRLAFAAPLAAETAADGNAQAATADDGAATTVFSTTNVQEAGVDEADYVKNTATVAYTLSGTDLLALQIQPNSSLAVLSRTPLGVNGTGLYLLGNRLAVLYSVGGFMAYNEFQGAPGTVLRSGKLAIVPDQPSKAGVRIFDVTSPAAPSQVIDYQFDGSAVDSRLIGSTVTYVVASYPNLPVPLTVSEASGLALDAFIPQMTVTTAGGATSGPAVVPTDSYYPTDPNGVGTTTVYSIDLTASQQAVASTMVVANAGVVYASPTSLYITDTQYGLGNDVRETTAIHKFNLLGGQAAYVGSGQVDGRPLNQFSLGEYNGYLRIATQTSDLGGPMPLDLALPAVGVASREKANAKQAASPGANVFVLGEGGGGLSVVGQITGLKPDEQLYAARFIGPYGFLVTFRQIDPLFTLDLSDPAAPRLVGELQVPGYSTYLQPLDTTHLIGIGRQVNPDNTLGGVQVSLFDVSNLASPVLQAQQTFGGSEMSSEAEYDHRAFTSLSTGPSAIVASLPLQENIYYAVPLDGAEPIAPGPQGFQGVAVMNISATGGISVLGQVPNGAGYSMFQRGVFSGDNVTVVGSSGATAAPLSNLASTTSLAY